MNVSVILVIVIALAVALYHSKHPDTASKAEDESPISRATRQMVEDYHREKKAAEEEIAAMEAAEKAAAQAAAEKDENVLVDADTPTSSGDTDNA